MEAERIRRTQVPCAFTGDLCGDLCGGHWENVVMRIIWYRCIDGRMRLYNEQSCMVRVGLNSSVCSSGHGWSW